MQPHCPSGYKAAKESIPSVLPKNVLRHHTILSALLIVKIQIRGKNNNNLKLPYILPIKI